MGDHVKGSLTGQYPKEMELGIKFHRSIDAYVDRHATQQLSISRFPKPLRRYGGIACDVIYDYYLANHWRQFHHVEFSDFCQSCYRLIIDDETNLTPGAFQTISRMAEYGSLEGYTTKRYVERSLFHISQRLKRENPVKEIYPEFENLETELEQDFFGFIPEVDEFAADWLKSNLE